MVFNSYMEGFKDLYATLGVASTAPHEVIRAAYRVLAKLHHPDVNTQTTDNAIQMACINQAYAVLSCPQRRREYDQCIEQAQKQLATKRGFAHQNTAARFNFPTTVLTTYDHRGRLHAYI